MQNSATGVSSATNTTTPASWLESGGQLATTLGTNISNTPWTPYAGQSVAGLSGNQQQAANNAASEASAYNAPGGLGSQATQCMTGANLQPYINPYTGGQVGALTQRIQAQYAPVQSGLTGTLAQGGNLSSNRAGIVQGQLGTQEQNAITCMAGAQYGGAVNAGTQAFLANRGNAAAQGADIENQLQTTGALQQNVAQQQANFCYGQYIQQQHWAMCHQLPGAEMAVEGGAMGAPVTTSEVGNNALTQTAYGSALGALAALGGAGAKAYNCMECRALTGVGANCMPQKITQCDLNPEDTDVAAQASGCEFADIGLSGE